ncbi:MAG: preprotein translocase subunit SecE [Eubacteriales bacterium]|jgi:preprotein translocase subunit SecE
MKDDKTVDTKKAENLEVKDAQGVAAPAKKADKPAAPKKKSFMDGLRRIGKNIAKWGRDLKGELKKIVWPSWKTTRNNTIVVLSVIAVAGVVIWLLDMFFENIILKGLLALVTGF